MQALTHAIHCARCAPDVRPLAAPSRHPPRMRSADRRPCPGGWHGTQRATHFFDAAWHSALTLRRLVQASLANQPLGIRPAPELLSQTMHILLDSLCPGLPDDDLSRRCFRELLHLHLSGLEATELRQLSDLLRQQRFACSVSDPVIDDAMLEEYGFTNGPPHYRQRTLMFTPDLHDALDDAAEAAARIRLACSEQCLPAAAHVQEARDVLADSAADFARSPVTLTGMAAAANRLALAIGLPASTDGAVAVSPLPPASSVAWEDRQLIVDVRMLAALRESGDRALHAEWTRDLLELLLMHRLFGTSAPLASLDTEQHALLRRSVAHVLSCVPTLHDRTLPARAAAVLGKAQGFGTVQIFPTAGTMLGHAWIAPSLSVIPDKSCTATAIGKRYMRPGALLKPVNCTVNEWGIRWLTQQENEDRYPAAQSWHLPVPAHWLALQQAAEQTREAWQRQRLPYRFIGTEPGMPPTGCRVTVWHAVQQAMDDDARALFEHFRQGLPDPESPTELSLRIGQFMDWVAALAGRAKGQSPDL